MTLYEMLDKTLYYQQVWIFETNVHDQNMPIFRGQVQDARNNKGERVWDYLTCEVDHYECTHGILDIRVKNQYSEERLEGHYLYSDRWGRARNKRPWLYSSEINKDKCENGGQENAPD